MSGTKIFSLNTFGYFNKLGWVLCGVMPLLTAGCIAVVLVDQDEVRDI
jgi:hypothetical protein